MSKVSNRSLIHLNEIEFSFEERKDQCFIGPVLGEELRYLHYVGLKRLKQACDLPVCLERIFDKNNEESKIISEYSGVSKSQSGPSESNKDNSSQDGDDFIVKKPKRKNSQGV